MDVLVIKEDVAIAERAQPGDGALGKARDIQAVFALREACNIAAGHHGAVFFQDMSCLALAIVQGGDIARKGDLQKIAGDRAYDAYCEGSAFTPPCIPPGGSVSTRPQ